ncbi:MAG: phosphotransferase [Planctomycetaceae bacterium]|nr:phosphotransferase [Planctomycetaceae bacterium]
MQSLPSDPAHPLRQSIREVLQVYPETVRASRPLRLATGGFSGAVVVQLSLPRPAAEPVASLGGEPPVASSPLILPAGTPGELAEPALDTPGPATEPPSGSLSDSLSAPLTGLMCLRCWPQGTERRRLDALHRFVDWLSRCGPFPVAVPVRNLQGQTVTPHAGRLWHLEPWLPGTADFHEQPEPERLQHLMRLLARVHETAARYEAPSADSQWFSRAVVQPSPAVQTRRKLLECWIQQKQDEAAARIRREVGRDSSPEQTRLAEDAARKVARLAVPVLTELKQAESLPVRVSPVLRDIWHDHVLWNGREVSGLIDLSAAGTESAAADLSRLLGSLAEDDRSLWQLALEEYRLHRRMTPEEETLVPILDRSGVLLSAAGWIDRHYLQNRGSLSLPGALSRLAGLTVRLDRMLSGRV